MQPDWKAKLGALKSEMIEEMSPEEKEKMRKTEQEEYIRRKQFQECIPVLYRFLAGYKQNSGIFINNFFRKRNYKMYCEDKFHAFDFDISGILPNVFDDFGFSMEMVGYLRKLEENEIAYFPINMDFMRVFVNFAEALDYSKPFETPVTLYRGCSTIERNGVNGIVSTTTDYKVAEQFSRGTIITLHVPAGTKGIDVKRIRPKEQRRKDLEKEILLPPCEYEIVSERTVPKGSEPNNYHGTTKLLEIKVKPLDLLTEFLKVLENPPEEYQTQVRSHQRLDYEEAVMFIRETVKNRVS